ncbi:MAG: hypothetical protein KKH28_04415 [Elusimicrobia bacterium]|nr:hypothetical protein [Elusimicrobiota bacterium]
MTYHTLLFALVTGLAVAAVMARSLLLSVLMLALVSVGASLILFNFQAPWAAVFELSVCAGLITALFIGAVTLVNPVRDKAPQAPDGSHERPISNGVKREDPADGESRMRFYAMPLVMAIAAIAAWFYAVPFFESLESWARFSSRSSTLGSIIWDLRRFDLLGQLSLLAAGVFALSSIFPGRKTQK